MMAVICNIKIMAVICNIKIMAVMSQYKNNEIMVQQATYRKKDILNQIIIAKYPFLNTQQSDIFDN